MVAVIHNSSSLRRAVNYNEQKLKEGKAEGLLAVNYPKDMKDLNFHEKFNRLKNQAELRPRTKAHSVHISLNFDPSEKLSKEQLQAIAQAYMEKIGFGDQPYLVYQHNDSGHPHLHIVSINITKDGQRIETHNLGKNQSEKARKEIEEDFGLVKAGKKEVKVAYELPPVSIGKVQYGKTETKRAISNVLNKVLKEYKFCSLAELNAILKQYNIIADRGGEDSQTFKRGGLVYRVLDENGNKIGVPIKASILFGKPTLENLEKLFKEKEPQKKQHQQRVKTAIDWALAGKHPKSLEELIQALKKENIDVVLRKSKDGKIYGITYVDHKTKTVLNGSDLGKQYSAAAMQERCRPEQVIVPPTKQQTNKKDRVSKETVSAAPALQSGSLATPLPDILHPLLDVQNKVSSMPYELKGTKKKKKRRRSL